MICFCVSILDPNLLSLQSIHILIPIRIFKLTLNSSLYGQMQQLVLNLLPSECYVYLIVENLKLASVLDCRDE
jgi:hypothetical protein